MNIGILRLNIQRLIWLQQRTTAIPNLILHLHPVLRHLTLAAPTRITHSYPETLAKVLLLSCHHEGPRRQLSPLLNRQGRLQARLRM